MQQQAGSLSHTNKRLTAASEYIGRSLNFNGGVVKGGTKVKNIRIAENYSGGDHDIDGIGAM